jgi:hypothetical protein
MNEPLNWELVPSNTGVMKTYRAKLDGKGWLVAAFLERTTADDGRVIPESAVGVTFVPDENNMWGK